MTEGAEAAIHVDDGSGADRADEPQGGQGDLRRKITNLGVMVTTYEGSPESIDGSNLADTKKMIADINKHIRDLIDSGDFEYDEHEYAEFYRTAMKALDKYGYVRAAYDKVDPSARATKLGQDDFAQAVQNAKLFIKQRWRCIEALRYLHDKLSSELDLFIVRIRLGIAHMPFDLYSSKMSLSDMTCGFRRLSLRGTVLFVDHAAEHLPTLHRRGSGTTDDSS